MRVKDIKKIEPLAECYHLPSAKEPGFLLIVAPPSSAPPSSSDVWINGIVDKGDDIMDGRIIFVDDPVKIFRFACPICKAFLECKNPDAKES